VKRITFVASLAAAILFLAAVGCDEPRGNESHPKPEAVRVIPLKDIYSTNRQKGLQRVSKGEDEPYARELLELRRGLRTGASNVLLVRGKDFRTAVKASWLAFTGGRTAVRPVVPDEGSKGAPLWLVGYLGISGSSPPDLLVQSAERKGNTIRLSYFRPKDGADSRDLHHYLVWVPLGELKAGSYTLELFDANKKEVTLLRRVGVPAE
jgi:hypothetical protein